MKTAGVGVAGVAGLAFSAWLLLPSYPEPHELADTRARNRVFSLATVIEEHAAGNGGLYPDSKPGGGVVSRLWKEQRPKEFDRSPFGGKTPTPAGVFELAPVKAGAATPEAALAAMGRVSLAPLVWQAALEGFQPMPERAGDLIYVSIQSEQQPWIAVPSHRARGGKAARRYAIGIFDRRGVPFWESFGGK